MNENEIRELFRKHNIHLSRNDCWPVQSAWVIKHAALERLAAALMITFDPPTILRAERDEAVILVTGRRGSIVEWDIGEALVGVNYKVSGKQPGYVYAMGIKRARDRVTLKLVQLYGAYSEDEADDFKQPETPHEPIKAPPAPPAPDAPAAPVAEASEPAPAKRGPGRPRKPDPEPDPGREQVTRALAEYAQQDLRQVIVEAVAAIKPEPEPEPTELFEYADPDSGEIRHVTEAELDRLEAQPIAEPPTVKETVADKPRARAAEPVPMPTLPAFLRRSPTAPSALNPPPGPLPPEYHGIKPATPRNGSPWPDAMADPDAWLKRLDTELSKLSDGDAMQALWEERVDPIWSELFPPDGSEAQAILRHHMSKVEP